MIFRIAAAALLTTQTLLWADKDVVIQRITAALPEGWSVVETEIADTPSWSFSKASADRITLVGPAKTGYSYFRADNSLIRKEFFMRESLDIWVAPKSFDPAMTFLNRLRNSFSVYPVKLPKRIQHGTDQVFVREGVYSLPSPYIKTSPEGTRLALPIEFQRTWQSYFSDIKNQIEQSGPENPIPSGTSDAKASGVPDSRGL